MLDVNELQEKFKCLLEFEEITEPEQMMESGYTALITTPVKIRFALRLDDEEQDVKEILKSYWICKLQETIQKLEAIE